MERFIAGRGWRINGEAHPLCCIHSAQYAHAIAPYAGYARLYPSYGLTGNRATIVELLALPGEADIEFEPPRVCGPLVRLADLT